METRANYILIGAFTLFGIIASLGFAVWLSNVQLDRQYAHYGILFQDVSGLDSSGDVVFNGIKVGRVIELHIYEPDPSQVYVGIEIDATTPVRADTVAQLSSSGVTGVAFVSLSSSGQDARPLRAKDGEVPIIPSRRSTVQQLVEDTPDLISEATSLLKRFQELAGPQNQAHVESILSNLSEASGGLNKALSDFSTVTEVVSQASSQIASFGTRIETLGAAAETTLANVDTALASTAGAFDTAKEVISKSSSAIDSAGAAFAEAETLMREQVPGIVRQIADTVDALNAAVRDISQRSVGTLDGFDKTTGLLNVRLSELEQTLADASTSFEAVTQASNSVYALVDGDGTLMVTEAREVLASTKTTLSKIEAIIDADVPAVVSDIRSAVSAASAAVDKAARDLSGFTDHLAPLANDTRTAVNRASDLFIRATSTLDGIDGSLVVADRALGSAGRAFDSANDAIATDLGPALTDIRAATDRISGAAQQVSDELPQITTDLRSLIARADTVVGQVQNVVSDATPGIRNFTGTGLNELGRLSAEARTLVQTLERLVRRIDKDPARFLLDSRVPDYRR